MSTRVRKETKTSGGTSSSSGRARPRTAVDPVSTGRHVHTASHDPRAPASTRTGHVIDARAGANEGTHRRSKEERECAQFLRIHQKLAGRKTTDEYATIRLVHRPNDAARKRHLHENRPKSGVSASQGHERPPRYELRVPQTARQAPHEDESDGPQRPRPRPQSAKPVLQTPASPTKNGGSSSGIAGRSVSVALLEKCYYNPIPLTTHLAASKSTSRVFEARPQSAHHCLQPDAGDERIPPVVAPVTAPATTATAATTMRSIVARNGLQIEPDGRQHIVVHMQRVALESPSDCGDGDRSDGEDSETRQPPVASSFASQWLTHGERLLHDDGPVDRDHRTRGASRRQAWN